MEADKATKVECLQGKISALQGSVLKGIQEIVNLKNELKATQKQLQLEVSNRKMWKRESAGLEAAFKVMRKQHLSET